MRPDGAGRPRHAVLLVALGVGLLTLTGAQLGGGWSARAAVELGLGLLAVAVGLVLWLLDRA